MVSRKKHQNPAAMEVEEEEEEKPAKNLVGSRSSPHFFKVFFPHLSSDRLKIPPAFKQHLENEPRGKISLKGPSGSIWDAELASDTEGLYFVHGWEKFVYDHSIKVGDFLVFRYDGCSLFSVLVFDSTACEKVSAFFAQPRQCVLVKTDEDEDDKGIVATVTSAPDSLSIKLVKSHEKISPNKSMKSLSLQLKKCNVPRRSKNGERVPRMPVLISQRRPITEEEKSRTLQRAMEFQSENPFTLQIMKDSYVYVGFFLNIPCDFVREHLPKINMKMTLWDPEGRSWEVNYMYYSNRCIGSFSGGWVKFAFGNNLETYDVCVFELIQTNSIRVHIYRVVPEITPLIRSSARK